MFRTSLLFGFDSSIGFVRLFNGSVDGLDESTHGCNIPFLVEVANFAGETALGIAEVLLSFFEACVVFNTTVDFDDVFPAVEDIVVASHVTLLLFFLLNHLVEGGDIVLGESFAFRHVGLSLLVKSRVYEL